MPVETFVPTGREFQHKSSTRWLKFKRIDDDIGPGLWRIHDGLYDFRDFTKVHFTYELTFLKKSSVFEIQWRRNVFEYGPEWKLGPDFFYYLNMVLDGIQNWMSC